MTILSLFAINTLAVAIGSFVGNFGLLWLIGNRAKALEENNRKQIAEIQKQFQAKIAEEIERKKEYIKLES